MAGEHTEPDSDGHIGGDRHAHWVLSAYSGEHGVYGVVLVTAVIAVSWDYDSDLDVLLFVVGTVFVFWLAHIYANVVASTAAAGPGGSPARPSRPSSAPSSSA